MVPSKIPPFVEPPPRGDTGRCWRCCDEEAKSSFCSHRVQRWEQISKQNKIHPVGDKGYGENEARNETGERWVCRGPQRVPQEGRAGKVMLTKALQPRAHDSPAQTFSTRGYSTLQVAFCNV